MAIGTTNISVGSIRTELGLVATAQSSINDVFGFSNLVDGSSSWAVNYHNIDFGPGGNVVDNIYTPQDTQTNLSLNNWRNYNHAADMVFKWTIQNTTRGTFDFEVSVDRPGYGAQSVANATIDPGGTWDEATFISDIASDPGAGYKIIVAYIGNDNSVPNVFNALDVDNVGPDTIRQLTPLPPFVPAFQPFYEVIIEGDGGQDIAWSKRTSFEMTI